MTTASALIQEITNGIIRQEGMPPDWANPGNLRTCPWLPPGQVISEGFWEPATRGIGIAGAAHVVALHIAEGNTLNQLINIWAPPSDGNDTAQYIANVMEWANIPDAGVPLWDYIEQEPSNA